MIPYKQISNIGIPGSISSVPGWVLEYDPFDNNSLNTSLWADNDPDNKFIEQNGRMELEVDIVTNNNVVNGGSAETSLLSLNTYSNTMLVAQADLSLTNYVGPNDTSFLYFGLNRANETNIAVNASQILVGRTSGKNDDEGARCQIWTGTSLRYDIDDGASYADFSDYVTVKIVSDSSHNQSFYKWSGGAWVQMGSTQVWNIRVAQDLRTFFKYKQINASDEDSIFHIRNYYLSSQDYTTQYPE